MNSNYPWKRDALVLTAFLILSFLASLADPILTQLLPAIRIEFLIQVFLVFTIIGSLIYVVVLIISLFLWVHERRYILPLWISLAATVFLTLLIKLLVHRPRPELMYDLPRFFIETSSGFPSMHAAVVFSLLPLIFLTQWKKWPFVLGAILVAFSRFYLGVHYLSDVLFGALLGYLCGSIVVGLFFTRIWTRFEKELQREIFRQAVHILLGIVILVLLMTKTVQPLYYLLFTSFACIVFLTNLRWPLPLLSAVFAYFDRPGTKYPGVGALTFVIGVALAVLLFPPNISYAAIAILALGDGIATFVGKYANKKLPWHTRKTIIGSIAGFLVAGCGAMFFVSPPLAFAAAFIGMIVESLPLPVDDNLIIPLVVGVFLLLV